MSGTSSDRRDQFIRERKYLLNVSEHTESWYRHALFKWLPSAAPNEADLKQMVIAMREAGLASPVFHGSSMSHTMAGEVATTDRTSLS